MCISAAAVPAAADGSGTGSGFAGFFGSRSAAVGSVCSTCQSRPNLWVLLASLGLIIARIVALHKAAPSNFGLNSSYLEVEIANAVSKLVAAAIRLVSAIIARVEVVSVIVLVLAEFDHKFALRLRIGPVVTGRGPILELSLGRRDLSGQLFLVV